MRVAYVCCDPGVPVFGCKGCSVHVQEVLRELVRRDVQVDLFATRIGGPPPDDLASVRVHQIELPKCKTRAEREQALYEANEIVTEMLIRSGPFQLIYERYSLFSYAAMEHARNWLISGILEVNSPLVEEQSQYRTLIDRELAERTSRRTMSLAGAVVAVSTQVASYVAGQRFYRSEIYVIPNGVDINRFQIEIPRTYPRQANEFTIGFVGTLKPWHGVSDLIKAFRNVSAEASEARLIVVGEGPERGRLEQQTSTLPGNAPSRVRFTGAVQPREVPGLLTSMDLAVAPFEARKGFYFSPLKVFEYMAASLPTVASDVGQIAEIIEHGKTGVLVPPGDPRTLTEAILEFYRQPEQCARMGEAARTVAENQFTWESVVRRILAIAKVVRRNLASQPKARPAHSTLRSGKNHAH